MLLRLYLFALEVDPPNDTTLDDATGVGGTRFGCTVSYAAGAGDGAVSAAGTDGVTVLDAENCSDPEGMSATDVADIL